MVRELADEVYSFRIEYGMDFEELREYSNTLEDSLESKLKKFNQMVDRKARKAPIDELDDLYSYYYFEEGGYKIQDRFPDLLRKSLFTSCYSSFEVELTNLCKFLKEKKGIKLGLFDLKDQGITKTQIYLKKVVGIEFPDEKSNEWGQIKIYNAIRNSIVHNNSILNDDRREDTKAIREFANTSSFLDITKKNEIKVSRDFTLEFLKTTELFLDKLYSPISKSPFIIENEIINFNEGDSPF